MIASKVTSTEIAGYSKYHLLLENPVFMHKQVNADDGLIYFVNTKFRVEIYVQKNK